MKLNEKLIKLRRTQGLSQEELGYKLNVTRQTISKWELGQTIPETDKLVTMSKIFGTTLDNLVSEEEIKVEESAKTEKKAFYIGKLLTIILIILIIIAMFWGAIKIFNKTNEEVEKTGLLSSIINIFKDNFGIGKNIIDTANKRMDSVTDNFENSQEDFEMKSTTNILEHLYNGTEYGSAVKNAIEQIVTHNKKHKEKAITVIYQETNHINPEDLKNLKINFKNSTEYEISYEYDENNYIYQMDIKNI